MLPDKTDRVSHLLQALAFEDVDSLIYEIHQNPISAIEEIVSQVIEEMYVISTSQYGYDPVDDKQQIYQSIKTKIKDDFQQQLVKNYVYCNTFTDRY